MSVTPLAKALDLISRKDTPIAMCRCGAPLISTCVWPQAEFYCLDCGAHLGFLDPHPADATPELNARLETFQAEWDKHVGPKLRIIRGWFVDCDKCTPRQEYHCEHATDEERTAHETAVAWLQWRASP